MQFRSLATAALLSAAQAVDVQVVSVGKNPANNVTGNQFWPESITAEPGSMVQFQFWAGNHTVTQSTFDSPCSPMEAVSNGSGNGTSGAGGIKSGFMDVQASMPDGNIPVYTVMVNDTEPLWFYCGQGSHCAGGMAMVINPAEGDKTLDAYKEAAAASTGGEGSDGEEGSGEDSEEDSEEGDSEDGEGSGGGNGGDGSGGDGSGGDNPDEVPGGEDDAATIGDGNGSGASSLSSSLLLGVGAAMFLF